MRRLVIVSAVVIAIPIMIAGLHFATKVDVPAKTERLRQKLEATENQREFIRIAEADGLKCKYGQASSVRVHCEWEYAPLFEPAMFMMRVGIWAEADFVDGHKAADYKVDEFLDGP